jgi:heme o synthase
MKTISSNSTLQQYYLLTKPGIIYGNAITATGGFLLASKGHIDYGLLIATLLGISLVIGSACVFNNYIDREIDAKMARTKKRALVAGLISVPAAMVYATVLGLLGIGLLAIYTNLLTVFMGLAGLVVYVILYGITKRRTVHGTVVGSVAGAMPMVAGYTAVTNRFDSAALILFLIMVAWQMPHFYAIAIYRFKDYKAAGLPVLPVKKNIHAAKVQILLYIVAFIIATSLLTVYGYTGYVYLVIMGVIGFAWLYRGVQRFKTKDNTLWARKMFLFSLIVILSLSVSLSVGPLLP